MSALPTFVWIRTVGGEWLYVQKPGVESEVDHLEKAAPLAAPQSISQREEYGCAKAPSAIDHKARYQSG